MLLSIAFYSATTLLSVGIITNICKVVKISKRIKALDNFENDFYKKLEELTNKNKEC